LQNIFTNITENRKYENHLLWIKISINGVLTAGVIT